MYRKTLIGAAAATLALSGAGFAVAAAGDDGPQAAPGGSTRTNGAVFKCDGGATTQVWNRISSTPSTFNEGTVLTVPGSVVVKGPKNGKDTLSIAFSGESNLFGSTDSDERQDWMGIEVHVDGVPIQPYTAVGDVYAFAGPGGYDSHAAQFCTKIGKGKHRVEVKLNLHDAGAANSLTGWIDDHTLHVERHQ
jgi:hypothetical protein